MLAAGQKAREPAVVTQQGCFRGRNASRWHLLRFRALEALRVPPARWAGILTGGSPRPAAGCFGGGAQTARQQSPEYRVWLAIFCVRPPSAGLPERGTRRGSRAVCDSVACPVGCGRTSAAGCVQVTDSCNEGSSRRQPYRQPRAQPSSMLQVQRRDRFDAVLPQISAPSGTIQFPLIQWHSTKADGLYHLLIYQGTRHNIHVKLSPGICPSETVMVSVERGFTAKSVVSGW